MNSLEKITEFKDQLMSAEPPDEQTAQLMQVGQNMMPFVLPMLPEDPAELDGHLLSLAKWACAMRSDDAAQEAAVMVRGQGGEQAITEAQDEAEAAEGDGQPDGEPDRAA